MRVVGILICLAITSTAQQPAADDPLNSAITEQQQGDYQSAIRDYRKVLQVHPDMVEAKVNLGAALAHVGQYDEAIAMYKSALPTLPFKNPVLLNLGLAYYKKGDFANAREQFEMLYKLQPKDTRIAILLGDTELRLQKAADAVALLEPMAPANVDNLDFRMFMVQP
jgi:tetratricopeptide (TPR) repeat protein